MWESQILVTDKASRIYTKFDGSMVFTVNAKFDGTDWTKDVTGVVAARFELDGGSNRIRFQQQDTTPDTWADVAWTRAPVDLLSTGTLQLGGGLDATFAEAETPRIKTDKVATGTDRRTLLWDIPAALYSIRLYATDFATTDSFELTMNARWDGSALEWNKDDAGETSSQYLFSKSLTITRTRSAIAGTWFDVGGASGWDNGLHLINLTSSVSLVGLGDSVGSSGQLQLIDGLLQFSVNGAIANPSATTSVTNQLRAKNLIKCWGNITTGTSTPTINDGFNLKSQQPFYNGKRMIVKFQSAMANNDYAVTGTLLNSVDFNVTTALHTTSQFEIAVFNSSGAEVTLSSGTAIIMFIVLGEQ